MAKPEHVSLLLAITTCACVISGAAHAQTQTNVRGIISFLADRMYATGETSPRPENFENEVTQARGKIKELVASSGESVLVEKDKFGMSPLMLASYYGFSGIVEVLLEHEQVKTTVNDVDSKGLSSWIYANFALQEALWVCNPTVLKNPFKSVPIIVQQPYYLNGSEPPYVKVRRMLENSGATHDMDEAKRQWASVCKLQGSDTEQRAASSDDLLAFVRKEGQEKLVIFMKDAAARKAENK